MTIADISNQIKDLFDVSRQPAPEIPGMLMTVGCAQKPGLSSKASLGNIVRVLDQHEIPTDPMPDGTENKTVQVVLAIVEEIYRAIKEDANIQVAHAPGAITIMASGANAGGPVVSQGININFSKGQAIVQ